MSGSTFKFDNDRKYEEMLQRQRVGITQCGRDMQGSRTLSESRFGMNKIGVNSTLQSERNVDFGVTRSRRDQVNNFTNDGKYQSLRQKLNPSDKTFSSGRSMSESRIGMNNYVNPMLSTQQFYDRTENRNQYQTSSNSVTQSLSMSTNAPQVDYSIVNSTKNNVCHSSVLERSNAQRDTDSVMSQKTFTQRSKNYRNDFGSVPSISGSLPYSQSESLMFKLPLPTRDFALTKEKKFRDKYLREITTLVQLVRPEDKAFLKFITKLNRSAISLYSTIIYEGGGFLEDINYLEMFKAIEQELLELYGTTPLHKAFSSTSSVITDNSAALVNNGLRQAQHVEPSQRDMCGNEQQTISSRPLPSAEPAPQKEATKRKGRPPKYTPIEDDSVEVHETVDESRISLFSIGNSRVELKKDEKSAQQKAQSASKSLCVAKTKPVTKRQVKPTPQPKRKNISKKDRDVTTTESFANRSESLEKTTFEVPVGAKAVTRTGRPVKSPVKWWSKDKKQNNLDSTIANKTMNESSKRQSMDRSERHKDVLNESIVLRNNKVLKKSPTNFVNIKDSGGNKDKNNTVKKSQPRKNVENKENISTQKKTKKQPSATSKTANKISKENQAKKGTDTNVEKKPVKKRKSDQNLDSMVENSKRKKVEAKVIIERCQELESSMEDDIFGKPRYMKSSQPNMMAISPTMGLLSAKKASSTSLSKETPPCKAMTMFMNNTCQSSASIHLQDHHSKQDAVVKRVTKKVKNQKPEGTGDKPDKKLKKDQNKKLPTALTRLNTPSISIVLGNDLDDDSEVSDFSGDDDLY